MVQIIDAPTTRQQALDAAFGKMADNAMQGYMQGQATQRQQALADQKDYTTFNTASMKAGYAPVSQEDFKAFKDGTYQGDQITPGSAAQPAVQAQPAQAEVQGQAVQQPSQAQQSTAPQLPDSIGKITALLSGSRGPSSNGLGEIAPNASQQEGGAVIPSQSQAAVPAQMARPAIPSVAPTYQTSPFQTSAQKAADLANKKVVADSTASLNSVKEDTVQQNADTNSQKADVAQQNANTKQAQEKAYASKLASTPSLTNDKQEQKTAKDVSTSILSVRGDSQFKAAKDTQFNASKAQLLTDAPGDWNNIQKKLGVMEAVKTAVGGVPGHAEMASVMGDSASNMARDAVSWVTNTPQDLNDPEYRATLSKYMGDLKDLSHQYIVQKYSRGMGVSGYAEIKNPTILARYESDPDVAEAAANVRAQQAANAKTGGVYKAPAPALTSQPGQSSAPKQAATGPHGPTVSQGGHTYNWNPSSGKYE